MLSSCMLPQLWNKYVWMQDVCRFTHLISVSFSHFVLAPVITMSLKIGLPVVYLFVFHHYLMEE